mmetsp:Transcript_40834/g.73738  ORF Transcript_40834/g.73738 Transcript_40834/m.73738 type:complete len:198 (-) Transcript_40834:62-655(-)
MKRGAPIYALRPVDPEIWSLSKRLRRLSVDIAPASEAVGADAILNEMLMVYDRDLLDVSQAPQVRLCDADGDVADEFWEERRCPGGGITLQEMSATKGCRLAIVAVQEEAHQSMVPQSLGPNPRQHVRAVEQVRLELMSRSVPELMKLLDRSGAGSLGLVTKAELVDRILSMVRDFHCVSSPSVLARAGGACAFPRF